MKKSVEEMSKEMTRGEFIIFVTENDLWPMDFDLPDNEEDDAWDKALVGIQFKAAVPMLPQDLTPVIVEISKLETQAALIKKQQESLREQLLEAMEKNNVKKFENDLLTITYVAPTKRSSIDSTKLKKDLPEVAEKYTKTSNVKSSIKIKLKGDE